MSKGEVWVTCPDCGERRKITRITLNAIYAGRNSGRCRKCATQTARESRFATLLHRVQKSYPSEAQVLPSGNKVLWDKIGIRDSKIQVPVYCSLCDDVRWRKPSEVWHAVNNTSGQFTGYCPQHLGEARRELPLVATANDGKDRVIVTCPSCGRTRSVSRRAAKQPSYTGLCYSCGRKKAMEGNERPHTGMVIAQCVSCGQEREVSKKFARHKGFTGLCHACGNAQARQKLALPPQERYRSGVQILANGNKILWDNMKPIKKNGRCQYYAVEVYCKPCNDTRWVKASDVYARLAGTNPSEQKFTGFCYRHAAKRGASSPNFRGGRVQLPNGYIFVLVNTLSGEDRALAVAMGLRNGRYILEHRLVMAKHLGRLLHPWEIVHHKNGDKADSRLENLQLKAKKHHNPAFGEPYYQLWQEALSENGRLKARLAQFASLSLATVASL